MNYKHAILGGTFDRLHLGHAHFISSAFKNSERVTIGLATNKLSEGKPLSYSIEDYKTRLSSLEKYLKKELLNTRAKIIKIEDIYGNSLVEKNIDAIFVTNHGLPSAKLINKRRLERGLNSLKINKVNFIKGKDGKIISSTRIRMGEIDRNGFPYIRVFGQTLRLPGSLRELVRSTPRGELIKTPEELKKFVSGKKIIISVGDIISGNLIKIGRQADISIVDIKSKREKIDKSLFKSFDISVRNNSGTINKNAALRLKYVINKYLKTGKKQVIKIIGEEDLMPLPAVLLAPLGSSIFYGMPDHGAVAVEVTEEIKKEIKNLLLKFNRAV